MTSSRTSETPATASLRVAVLGAGKMGGILLQAFLKSGLVPAGSIVATVAHEARAQSLAKQLGISVTTDNLSAAKSADILLLGVKPLQVADLVRTISPALTPAKLIISFAASVGTAAIEAACGRDVAVVRAM